MKKYIIIALAAVVALAACTKANPEATRSEKISFEVANYMPQTKANSSLDSEGYTKFNCYAWYFGAPMQYMNNVEVSKGTDVWAPANDYYWPKTGYINFYSYAGSQAPAVTPTSDYKTVTVKYDNTPIGAEDNFMVAKPALHFGIANADANIVAIDHEQGDFSYDTPGYTYTTSSQTYTGVPTLFQHELAKVAVRVKLATDESKKSANTIWTVTVKANGSDTPSNIKPINKGTLTLKNTDGATAPLVDSWTTYDASDAAFTANSNEEAIGWVASTNTEDKETIAFATKILTMNANTIASTTTENLLDVRTVMPQVTTGVEFNLTYEVSAKHTGETDPFMTEVLKIENKTLAAATDNTLLYWGRNQVIVYTITIDPVTQKVSFDPAVEEWTSATGAISLPNASL